MGSSQSSRRRRRRPPPPPPPPPGYHTDHLPPPPPGFHTNHLPPSCTHVYYHPHNRYYPINPAQGFIPQGPYATPPPPPSLPPTAPPPPLPALPAPHPVPEYQKAETVKNDVNLRKGTLRLTKDESSPGQHVVTFSFDAISAGSITVFFLAREAPDGSLGSVSPIFPQPPRTSFSSGLGQKFLQETGLDYSLIDEEDLSSPGPDNVYPLIIRIETVPKNPSQSSEEFPGGPLRKWINYQQTYAVIVKKGEGEYEVKVVKQIIWVGGVRYELQEIYGIGNNEESNSNSSDSGKECVICLSEPKDTTVLPCRHMCMCSDCANVLRHQSNLCPICRCPIEELIQIKVSSSE